MKRVACALVMVVLLLVSVIVFAQNNLEPALQSIARSDSGLYAAVGDAGFIITSDNGVSWTKRSAPAGEKLNRIVWGMGKFVAVGDKGTILTSTDGVGWTKANIDEKINIYGAASSGREFVVAGHDGTILVSKDGDMWNRRRMATAESIYRVRWVNGRYIAVGGGMLILTSTDGITWDEVKSEPASTTMFTDVAWDGDKYIVVGDHLSIWLSRDGITWTQDENAESVLKKEGMDISECIYSVVWTGNKFLVAGHGGNILSSLDAYSWHKEANATGKTLKDVIYSKDKFIAIGDEGTILNSEDGVSWNNLNNISAESNEVNLKAGEQKQLKIILSHPYGVSTDVTDATLFEVSGGDDILTVEKNGTMKAVSEGQALVKTTYDYKSIEVLVNIEPANTEAGKKPQSTDNQANRQANGVRLSNVLLISGAMIAVVALITIALYNKRKRRKS
ncbi:WD40/YVTN/BNR-like repeat-containing protein [Acetivibrio cellulolyticus]|uniref:WD40/YVTN/BNR-like repeat-containing protein n=1 Tax=Acetivibrio cellulolyticus TaxID=35830 RepID=UPI0001E2C1DA|nr:hypothetical protein [Acetivibrio cellulolyticus]